jgi:hypothetical protein
VIGGVVTWYHLKALCKEVYPDYYEEGLISMFGMMTGTISSGILLLREVDPDLATPAANNLVIGSSFGIILGIPVLILVGIAPRSDLMCWLTVLIAAVYLILGFVSADGGLPGIGKMASFIYEKTGGILRGRKAGRFLRENGLRRDLAILYPFGRTQQEARRFYIERIRIVLLILLAGDILAIAGYASAGMDQLLTEHNKLVRDEIGGEDRSTQVEVSVLPKAHSEDGTAGKEDTVYRGNYRLEVRSRKYDQGQAGVLADRLFKILPERILGKNSDLGHVTSRLFLPEEVEGFPFSIAWESSSYALVDSDGMVGNLAMEINL